MFDPDKALQKPLPCYEVWDDMIPADGGRMCKGCGKLVIDFRKSKWKEIEKAKRESTEALCGIYNPKQIESWGCEVPRTLKPIKSLRVTAALITLLPLLHSQLMAQTKTQAPQVKNVQGGKSDASKSMPSKRFITGTVLYQLNDSVKSPVLGANVVIVCDSQTIMTITDSLGDFSLDITDIYKELPDSFEVKVAHPKHLDHIIEVAKPRVFPSEFNYLEITLTDIQIKENHTYQTVKYGGGYSVATYRLPLRIKIRDWLRRLGHRKSN